MTEIKKDDHRKVFSENLAGLLGIETHRRV